MYKTKNNGITLISLIITIIILLILAGITISQLTGSGLFENTKLAGQKSKEAQEKEELTLADYENMISEYVDGSRDENNNLEWKYLGSETGMNSIQLPSNFNELCVKVIEGAYKTSYVFNIPKVLLCDDETNQNSFFNQGLKSSIAQIMCTISNVRINQIWQGDDNYTSTSEIYVWYR